ncbi:MAG: diguanylate cyclase [Treponemataceae bacterium]|nr:diguanylate cyclase [Treponemataceae bacterium]
MVQKIPKRIKAIIIFVILIALLALLLTLQQLFSDYKLKKNLSAYQQLEMKTTVDNFILMLDSMRQGIIKSSETYGYNYSDEIVKGAVADYARSQVHQMNYKNGSYIWINEIRNWEGGDDYAVRLVHGNFPETEGTMLSTSMQDAQGNYPYLEELQGVREKGEHIYEYYFKEYRSEKVSKKITYAKLYPEYDWIVCVGTYYSSMYAPAGGVGRKENAFFLTVYTVIILTAIGLAIYIFLLFLHHSKKLILQTQKLKGEVAQDLLTGAASRSFGNDLLTKYHDDFKLNACNHSLAIFDIDNFKTFNDTYGHNVGDKVIKTIVSAVTSNLRKDDYIVRWGGDEFVLVYKDLREDIESHLADLNKKVSECQVTTDDGEKINFTISIGASSFKESDKSYIDAIKRTDDALYLAKRNKNTYYLIQ